MIRVRMPFHRGSDHIEAIGNWIRANCSKHNFNVGRDVDGNTEFIFSFAKKKDATMFILRWK